jgi:hypothetical protein
MTSGLTSLYLKHYKEFRQQEIDKLKSLLQNREIHHKVEDAVSEYRLGWESRMKNVENKKYDQDGLLQVSYFREILFEKFLAYLPNSFYDEKERFPYEIERILDRPLQEVKNNYYFNYEGADESAKYQRFFDHEEVENLKKDDLAKILAEYHALYRFIDEVDLLAIELDRQIEDEKRLVKENKFNDLPTMEVYHFFLQLIESSPENKKPMLNKDQIFDLTNMICSCDFKPKLEADITGRSGQLTYFFYKFYKYCTTSWDIGGKEEKYFSILTGCIKQFNNGTYKPNLKNFSRNPPAFEINLPLKYNA